MAGAIGSPGTKPFEDGRPRAPGSSGAAGALSAGSARLFLIASTSGPSVGASATAARSPLAARGGAVITEVSGRSVFRDWRFRRRPAGFPELPPRARKRFSAGGAVAAARPVAWRPPSWPVGQAGWRVCRTGQSPGWLPTSIARRCAASSLPERGHGAVCLARDRRDPIAVSLMWLVRCLKRQPSCPWVRFPSRLAGVC